MRNSMRCLGLALALTFSVVGVSPILAADASETPGSAMGQDMMKNGGMMNMMQQMTQMMDSCNKMMQSKSDAAPDTRKPNEQWQKNAAPHPEKNG